MRITRRAALAIGAGALAGARLAPPARAAEDEVERHGISAFGDLKYPVDFKRFDYVDPNAPKGGMFSQIGPVRQYNQNFLTFNSLNSYILKGDAAQGIEMTFATLMARAIDEPDAMYGYAARGVRISADGLTYRYAMRPEAHFHDGTKLTAQDAAFTFALLKDKGHPLIVQLLHDFDRAEAEDDATLVVRFKPGRGRTVPLYVAGLPIFSRAYYTTHPFDQSTLDVPLGSGAYRVGHFDVGHYIEYERVKDFWGAALPVAVGTNNFDIVRYDFYRDREVGFIGFTAKNYLFREEFTSRVWATRYDFPAVRDGRVKRETLPDGQLSGAQGWFPNMRRDKFKDRRVREALIDAFDFEWTNKNVMYGLYQRTVSMFQNSPLMASGKPSAEELALLEPFRGKVPDEVFGEPYVPPVNDGSGQIRPLLAKASALLTQAGFTIKNGKRVDPQGNPFTIEFLVDDPTFEPHHLAYIKNLALLGIDANIREVDAVQYKRRVDERDFDITVERLTLNNTPSDELRAYLSSQAARINGTYNVGGIADPAIDALTEKVIAADTRAALTTACRALDRVIRAGRYWVPQWYRAAHLIAYWDVFGRPSAPQPRYDRGIPDIWWYDREKANKLERAG
ncbi:MAG TPA: extracellular solute-binding protein [Xanthobacteraceae bacterium]|nr:extracellular solute-binding protein [Xanthobacteraceae bacterium]